MSIPDTAPAVKGQPAPMWETALDHRPPSNTDAEKGLLGAFLISNRAIELVPDLRAEHFFHPLHGDIFDAISAEIFSGNTVSATTLAPRFRNVKIDHKTTGAQYLGSLILAATTPASVREYAQTVIDLAQRRALIVVAEDLSARAFDDTDATSPAQLIEDAEKALFRVATRGTSGRETSLKDAAQSAVEAIAKAHRLGGRIDGIQTGFYDLDDKLGGLGNGNLIILAGRPSMGKTALATNIATNVARGLPWTNPATGKVEPARPTHVHFFSQEMTASELALRQIADLSGVSSHELRRGNVDENQFRDAVEAAKRLGEMPMTIDETGGITISSLSTKARREKRRNGTGLIVIDYLQLMQGSGTKGSNRVQDVTEITTGLKALAKELNVPVIALSQLSRNVESREDKRPQLSDLRESGSIEQDADVVLFVYRDEYYIERAQPPDGSPGHAEWRARLTAAKGLAEVIAAKQRHGPLGAVQMHFDGARTRFSDLAKHVGGAP